MPDLDSLFDRAARELAAVGSPLDPAGVRHRADRRARHRVVVVAAVLVGAAAVGVGRLAETSRQESLEYAQDVARPPGPAPSTGAPAASSRTGGGWTIDAAFLSPDAAAAAEEPGWAVDAAVPAEPGPLLDPCGRAGHPLADQVLGMGERKMSWTRNESGSVLYQEVFRYASPDAAASALQGYAEEVVRCRLPATGTANGAEYTVVDDPAGALLIRRRNCNPGCTDLYTSWLMVVQVDDAVTVTQYSITLDGDPEPQARRLFPALQEQLRAVVAGSS